MTEHACFSWIIEKEIIRERTKVFPVTVEPSFYAIDVRWKMPQRKEGIMQERLFVDCCLYAFIPVHKGSITKNVL